MKPLLAADAQMLVVSRPALALHQTTSGAMRRRAVEEAARARGMVLAREKVLAVVIHDLRTPLQIIGLGASQLHSAGDPAQSALAGRMLRATGVMRRLIDNLVHDSLSEAAAGPRREPIAAQALMCDVFDTMEMIATRAGVALELGSLPEVDLTVDYAQMLRVFGNLIGNSIKYCPPGSAVVLAGGLDGDSVWLSVSDNGSGMSAEDQGRAFEAGPRQDPRALRRQRRDWVGEAMTCAGGMTCRRVNRCASRWKCYPPSRSSSAAERLRSRW